MKIGFNEATASGCSCVEKDVFLCGEAGFDYIELRLDMLKTHLKSHSIEELAKELKRQKLKPHALNAIYTYAELFTENDNEKKQRGFLDEFLFACDCAKQIGSNYLVIVPPMRQAEFTAPYMGAWEQILKDCVRILGRLSDIAEHYDVNLCVEPVGAPKSSVRTAKEADVIIRTVNKGNVGVVLDAYNLYMAYMDNIYEDIRLLDADKIFAVHINNADAVEPCKEARRFCNSGVIDLSSFLEEIKLKEYDGMVSIETFRPEYWRKKPEEIIPLAYRTTYDLLLANGCIGI